eukprot:5972600-Prymnesium_polylepis.1
MRPWCLIELLEASRKGIPIVIVRMSGRGFDFGDARAHMLNLEAEMGLIVPSGLALLREHIGQDLSELKKSCLDVLDAQADTSVMFDSQAGDNAMVATMKDVVERMAKATSRSIVWMGPEDAKPSGCRIGLISSYGAARRRRKRLMSMRIED